MKKTTFFLSICLLLLTQTTLAQLRMSKRMQYSQTASPYDKQLFLIDYWATWCAPCIHVSKYLNVIQKKYAKDLYILSLTEESADVVDKFLSKHRTELAVSLDYDGENFKKNNVKTLPYGILLSAEGKILWRGNPADLKEQDIDYYLRKNKKRIPIVEFLTYESYEKEVVQELKIEGSHRLTPLNNSYEEDIPEVKQLTAELIGIKGSLKQIMCLLLSVSPSQIAINEDRNKSYELVFNQNADKKEIASNIAKELALSQNLRYQSGQTLQLTLLSYDKVWNSDQIQWGFPNSKILIDDAQLTLDNFNLQEVVALLALVKNTPILLKNNPIYVKKDPFDWQIQYKFDNLFLEGLNNYGFKTEIKVDSYPSYIFK